MSELVIGTESGVFAYHADHGKLHPEEGPASIAYMATSGSTVYAVESPAKLWARTAHNVWSVVNERAVDEEVWSVGADMRVPGLVYLGVSPAMLYRSTDAGKSFEPCSSIRDIPGYEKWSFPPPPHIPHVRSIQADPNEAGAVLIGVEEGGVYRSRDAGATWESLNEGLYWDVHNVVAPVAGSRVYATTGAGFHRSDDGGAQWAHMMNGLDRRYTMPLVASSARPDVLYTAAAATPPPGWRRNGTANVALYRSRDGGGHWERLQKGLPEPFDTMVRSIVQDEDGALFVAAEGDVYVSTDDGDSWTQAASGLPPVRALAVV